MYLSVTQPVPQASHPPSHLATMFTHLPAGNHHSAYLLVNIPDTTVAKSSNKHANVDLESLNFAPRPDTVACLQFQACGTKQRSACSTLLQVVDRQQLLASCSNLV